TLTRMAAPHAPPLPPERNGREFEDFLVLQVGVGSAVSASLARQIENAVELAPQSSTSRFIIRCRHAVCAGCRSQPQLPRKQPGHAAGARPSIDRATQLANPSRSKPIRAQYRRRKFGLRGNKRTPRATSCRIPCATPPPIARALPRPKRWRTRTK